MPASGTPGVDIIVPTYNEEASIDAFIRRIDALGLRTSLIIVDNASTDATLSRVEQHAGIRIIRHPSNLGYGASIRDGLQASTARSVVIIDADLEYPPEAIPHLLAALESHAVVYASRFLDGPPEMPPLRRWGNTLVSRIFNVLFGQRTTDLYTGMKALRREAVAALALSCTGFEHVAEMATQLASAGIAIHEVPVAYTPRVSGASKMRHIPEALKFAWLMASARVRALRNTRP